MMESRNHSNSSDAGYSYAAGATILSPAIMFLAGVLGNILALYTLYRTRTDMRSSKFYTLVTGLVWTDLIGILMTSPSVIAAYINGRQWVGGDFHCRYHGFTMTCFGIATPLIISAMAVERFLSIKWVFFYYGKCSRGVARGLIVVLWMAVIGFGLLPLFGLGKFAKQYPGTWCFLDFHSQNILSEVYAYIYASLNLLLIAVMIFCNSNVVITLFNARFLGGRSRIRQNNVQSERDDMMVSNRITKPKHSSVEIQMIVLMCAITTVFAVCWAPLMINIIVTIATGTTNNLWDLTAVRLASLNQTLDPWLYILLRRSLCSKIKKNGTRLCTRNDNTKRDMYVRKNDDIHIVRRVIDGETQNTLRNENRLDNDNGIGMQCMCDVVASDINSNRSLPVIMPKRIPHQDEHALQLPDVTKSRRRNKPDFVCLINFGGNNHTENKDEGIYVKIVFVPKASSSDSTTSSHSKHAAGCEVIRTHSAGTLLKPNDSCHILKLEADTEKLNSTNETSLGWMFGGDTKCHSEMLPNPHNEVKHERLRRTKSHT